MPAFLTPTRVCSVIVCVMFCLRRVETESRFCAYAVRVAPMILRTAGFLCALYADTCVNATAGQKGPFFRCRGLCCKPSVWSRLRRSLSSPMRRSSACAAVVTNGNALAPRKTASRTVRGHLAVTAQNVDARAQFSEPWPRN